MQVNTEEVFGLWRCIRGEIAANDGGRIADHRLEGIGGLVGLGLLPETQQRGEHHHRADHDGALHVLGQIGDDGQQRQQQVEGVLVAVPQVHPPGQRLFVFDLVQADAGTYSLGLCLGQTIEMAVQLLQQCVSLGHGGTDQGLGERRRHFAADTSPGQGVQKRPAAEVPGQVTGAQEACEQLFQQCEFHSCSPGLPADFTLVKVCSGRRLIFRVRHSLLKPCGCHVSRQERHREQAQADGEPSFAIPAAVAVAIGRIELDAIRHQPVTHAELMKGLALVLAEGLGNQPGALGKLRLDAQAPGQAVAPGLALAQPTGVGMHDHSVVAEREAGRNIGIPVAGRPRRSGRGIENEQCAQRSPLGSRRSPVACTTCRVAP